MPDLYRTTCQQTVNDEDHTLAFYCMAENDDDARKQTLDWCANELGEPVLQAPYTVTCADFAATVDNDPLCNFGSWLATWDAKEALLEWRRGHCTQTLDMFAEATL